MTTQSSEREREREKEKILWGNIPFSAVKQNANPPEIGFPQSNKENQSDVTYV